MVLPDDQMPKRKFDGKPLELILSPNSVIGRLNPGQIHETTINRIAEEVRKEILSLKSIEEKHNLYLEFIKDLLPERLHDQIKQIEKLKGKKLEEFINSIENDNHLRIPQVPFEHMSMNLMAKWYNKYKLENDIVLINGKEVMNPILTGMQYIMKLKHVPEKKLSACNSRKYGSKSLQPAKDTSLKTNKIPIGSSPNTIGVNATPLSIVI